MLFENNNYNYDYDYDLDVDLNLLNLSGFDPNNIKRIYDNAKLYSIEEGFLRGNMWKNEYLPYKNLKYGKLVPTNQEEALKFKIMAHEFALNDFNLYLDLHPDDIEIYQKFKECIEHCLKLQDEYAKKYGPLMLVQDKGTKYDWIKNPWPWDNDGGSMYV